MTEDETVAELNSLIAKVAASSSLDPNVKQIFTHLGGILSRHNKEITALQSQVRKLERDLSETQSSLRML